ncbi:hypothetical protein JB92DRAFT_1460468 [Gautieria morchelliformis]|nr:hypothetical protein JB92DRAFT_1460468 [Gautieria morchelliformis]
MGWVCYLHHWPTVVTGLRRLQRPRMPQALVLGKALEELTPLHVVVQRPSKGSSAETGCHSPSLDKHSNPGLGGCGRFSWQVQVPYRSFRLPTISVHLRTITMYYRFAKWFCVLYQKLLVVLQSSPAVLHSRQSHRPARMPCTNTNRRLLKSPKAPAQLHSVLTKPPVWPIMDVTSISLPAPPLQLGDLGELGFSNMTPVGAVQAALKFIQVTTGLPWWGTIVSTTTLIRLALVHFAIKQVRTTAAMAPVRPQMNALIAEVKEARLEGDNTRAQVAVLKVRKLQRETGAGLGAVADRPLLQVASSIVMFLAIKKLCNFPLAQLNSEGVGWFPSLASGNKHLLLCFPARIIRSTRDS